MYLDEYKRWLAADLEDADLKPELARIEGNDEEIKDRFAVALKFGTAGLRGVLGAGTNRMNIYVVRQATQGLVSGNAAVAAQTKGSGYFRILVWNVYFRDFRNIADLQTLRVRTEEKRICKYS